jgi:hypothetical protein
MPAKSDTILISSGDKLIRGSLQSRAPSLCEPPQMEDMWDHSDVSNSANNEEIMRWILEDDIDNTISQLGRLVGNKMSESRAFNVTSREEIEEFNKKAESLRKNLYQ